MFRPCIDLHDGQVKQLVGGTLDSDVEALETNFVSTHSAGWYADQYRRDGLVGGHVIMLGPGNEDAAREALGAYPGGLQIGGGITPSNALEWIDAGASHVIVTSYLFPDGAYDPERLIEMCDAVGSEQLVVDLSCRRRNDRYVVVSNRWQTFTDLVLSADSIAELGTHCAELLVHGVDVEGLSAGIDLDLVRLLADWATVPVTYAGGATSLTDLETIAEIGRGRIDLTIGSALDIFGGTGVAYEAAVAFNNRPQN